MYPGRKVRNTEGDPCHKIAGPVGGTGKGDFLHNKGCYSFSWAASTKPGESGELRDQRQSQVATGAWQVWASKETASRTAGSCSRRSAMRHKTTEALSGWASSRGDHGGSTVPALLKSWGPSMNSLGRGGVLLSPVLQLKINIQTQRVLR